MPMEMRQSVDPACFAGGGLEAAIGEDSVSGGDAGEDRPKTKSRRPSTIEMHKQGWL
jgi:hypothetical protein